MSSKSDSIQHKYREVNVDPVLMNNFADNDGLFSADYEKTDELLDLVDELNERMREIVATKLTARQRQVMHMTYYDGMTQTEIARALGLCQPTIHKTAMGNIDYINGGKRYGGAVKKIQKLCETDERIQYILKRITEIKTGTENGIKIE